MKIISAKSLNEVFKAIVPYLFPVYKEELSYNGMHGKAYTAEIRDKNLAVAAFEKAAKKIKEH